MSVTPTVSKPASSPPQQAPHDDVDLSCESVAGEEDPGASLDLSAVPVPVPVPAIPASDQNVPA